MLHRIPAGAAALAIGLGSEQAAWLEQQLADASAQPGYRFSIVYFHRPFITLSEYSQDKAAREYSSPSSSSARCGS